MGPTQYITFFSAQFQTSKIFIGTKKLITEILEENVSHFTDGELYLLRFYNCHNNRAEGIDRIVTLSAYHVSTSYRNNLQRGDGRSCTQDKMLTLYISQLGRLS